MKRNNVIVKLSILLAVLAAVALAVANPFKREAVDATGAIAVGDDSSSGKLLVDVASDAISAISIKGPSAEEFRLVKDADVWYAVQGEARYKANMDRVEKLLEKLPGLRSEALVSDKPEKYASLGVDDDSAFQLGVFTGSESPAAQLMVGNAAPGYTSCFVRLGTGADVYEAAENIKSEISFSYRDFRSLQPWNFDPQLVSQITVRPVSGTAETYAKSDGVWKTASGANANNNLIVTLLKDWSECKVSEFADDVKPGSTPFDASIEGADSAGTGGKDAKGTDLPAQFKLGLEPNLLAETPQGKFSFTLGVKEGGLYYVADQAALAYKLGEPALKFFRELKYDELRIPAAEEAADLPAESADAEAAGEG